MYADLKHGICLVTSGIFLVLKQTAVWSVNIQPIKLFLFSQWAGVYTNAIHSSHRCTHHPNIYITTYYLIRKQNYKFVSFYPLSRPGPGNKPLQWWFQSGRSKVRLQLIFLLWSSLVGAFRQNMGSQCVLRPLCIHSLASVSVVIRLSCLRYLCQGGDTCGIYWC